MASKLFILCAFAIVLIGIVLAFDYEEGEGSDEGSSEGGGDDGGYVGGDYETDGGESAGDGGDYVAPAGEETYDSAASQPFAQIIHPKLNRKKRSLNTDDSKRVLRRVRRGGKGRVGPVYTYQKTDHHANFKWGYTGKYY